MEACCYRSHWSKIEEWIAYFRYFTFEVTEDRKEDEDLK